MPKPQNDVRRKEIQMLRAAGSTYHEISRLLNISESVVRYYLRDLAKRRKPLSKDIHR